MTVSMSCINSYAATATKRPHLDGAITKTRFDEKVHTSKHNKKRSIASSPSTGSRRGPLTTALDIARMTSNACPSFHDQNETEQRKLLQQATWNDGGCVQDCSNPFRRLRRSSQLSRISHSLGRHDGPPCVEMSLDVEHALVRATSRL